MASYNPWWRDPQAIEADPQIKSYASAKVRWRPSMMDSFDLSRYALYIIRGPRQVGKTTMLKLMVRERLAEGVDPTSILYYSCDNLRDRFDLQDMLEEFLTFSAASTLDTRKLILLDEASSLKEWELGLKVLVDKGALKECTLLLTGSHSLDLKRASDRLPGRRGDGGGPFDRHFRTLSFADYVGLVSPRTLERIAMHMGGRVTFDSLFAGEVVRKLGLVRLMPFLQELEPLFHRYLLTGGIVRAINQHEMSGQIPPESYEVYSSSLAGDLARWGLDARTARGLLRSCAARIGSKVSLNALAKENGMGSHNTASSYLSALEGSYVLTQLLPIELHRGTSALRKERKVYFSDPFIFHCLREWSSGTGDPFAMSQQLLMDPMAKGAVVEMVVCGHLASKAHDLAPSDVLSTSDRLFYWQKSGTEREVDFVMRNGEDWLPVEVKYQNKVTSGDLAGLRTFKRGLILTKNQMFDSGPYSAIPVTLGLLMMR